MIDINYLAVLVSAIVAMIIGYVWYGPIFGKKWMQVVGVTPEDVAARERMQKSSTPLYIVQFILVLFQVYVLASYTSSISGALWIWAGFILPTVAASCMWNNDSSKVAWTRFFIQAGYQLIVFVIFGFILGMWK
ncbi:MAG TPA: DUF1761 domain-containing protein [Candidatus Paceibacterota bacterium]